MTNANTNPAAQTFRVWIDGEPHYYPTETLARSRFNGACNPDRNDGAQLEERGDDGEWATLATWDRWNR